MTRRILFCTIGATPQVVTETVWALLRQRTPPWIPDEIHIVTTTFKLVSVCSALQSSHGQLAMLLGNLPLVTIHIPSRSGTPIVFEQLRAAGDWDDPNKGMTKIEVIDPAALNDVNSQDDAAIMGNLILRLMARFTHDPDTEIHISLAGGRKTMSAHALLALSLVGRARDEASHVLVSPVAFEDHPEFWHPEQGGFIHTKEDLRRSPLPAPTLDPKNAHVALVPTPAPLMRHEVKDAESLERLDLAEIVKLVNLAAVLRGNPHVRLDTKRNAIQVGGVERIFGPKLFAIYRLMAIACKEDWPGVGPDGYGKGAEGWLSVPYICVGLLPSRKRIEIVFLEYLRDAVRASGGDPADHESIHEWEDGVVIETAQSKKLANAQSTFGAKTRLEEVLKREFGGPAADIIGPATEYKRQQKLLPGDSIKVDGSTRFGLNLPPRGIEIK
jgi:CRISPR-associated protein (TIGR02584 family)